MIKLIVFDYNRTLFDVDKGELIPGCEDMLNRLAKNYKLVIFSTQQPGRVGLIKKSLGRFKLDKIIVVKRKSETFLRKLMAEFGVNSNETMVVGDYLKQEILLGNKVGARTVWVKTGKFSGMRPASILEEPDSVLEELNYANLQDII